MNVPKYNELYKPLLQCLADAQPHSYKDIRAQLAQLLHLSATDINELLPSGRQTFFANRIGWASTYLKKAGLIESPKRGFLQITTDGKEMLSNHPDQLNNVYLQQHFPTFAAFISTQNSDSADVNNNLTSSETPDDLLENAYSSINQKLSDDLMTEIMKLDPITFEKMVLDLLGKMGYGRFSRLTTPASNDEGIDGILMEDKLGFNLIYIQVKQWKSDHIVSRPDIQSFAGALVGKNGNGLFITTSSFSQPAIDYAKKCRIILIDGKKLTQYMIEYNFGVHTKKIFEIKEIDSDTFDSYQEL